jgi:hypothetical protein
VSKFGEPLVLYTNMGKGRDRVAPKSYIFRPALAKEYIELSDSIQITSSTYLNMLNILQTDF